VDVRRSKKYSVINTSELQLPGWGITYLIILRFEQIKKTKCKDPKTDLFKLASLIYNLSIVFVLWDPELILIVFLI